MSAVRHGWLVVVTAIALGGCAHGIIPHGAGSAVPPPRHRLAPNPPTGRVARPVPAEAVAPLPAGPGNASAGNAAGLGLVAGPPVAQLVTDRVRTEAALAAFRISCPALARHVDISGLTVPADWTGPCAAAADARDAGRFFAEQFVAVQVGNGRAYVTGYFEPSIEGSLTRQPGFDVPVYGRPDDLIDVDLDRFEAAGRRRQIHGRVQGHFLVPYDDRWAIEHGALNGRAPIIAWARDSIDYFFLQVQGSGRLILPDGRELRVGFAGENGRDYTAIGKLMHDRGLIGPGQLSMQGIVGWLRAHPDQAPAILDANQSFVFFRLLDGPAIGALGTAVTPRETLAADPAFVPLGAPVWLSLDRAEPNGLWIAQDTGGAIKGPNRFDSFWGAGDDARAIAGGMSGRGSALILLPRTAAARLGIAAP